MPRPLPPQMETLFATYFAAEGDLGPAAREAVRRLVGARSGGAEAGADGADVAEAWRAVLEKLAVTSWKVLDEDVEGLRRAGLSDGEVFDLVVTAALAAGEARMRRVYAWLAEDD